jgi:hypothetical protein
MTFVSYRGEVEALTAPDALPKPLRWGIGAEDATSGGLSLLRQSPAADRKMPAACLPLLTTKLFAYPVPTGPARSWTKSGRRKRNQTVQPALDQAVAAHLLAMADDELILGHRNSEWTGHAPILEEDIAFTNIALDELGHARLWYELHGVLTGASTDRLVFFRNAAAYRNVRLVELPRGDWAFTMLRQYLFDSFEVVRAELLLEQAITNPLRTLLPKSCKRNATITVTPRHGSGASAWAPPRATCAHRLRSISYGLTWGSCSSH